MFATREKRLIPPFPHLDVIFYAATATLGAAFSSVLPKLMWGKGGWSERAKYTDEGVSELGMKGWRKDERKTTESGGGGKEEKSLWQVVSP